MREDYDVDHETILHRFGSATATSVDALTKEFRGVKRPEAEVFSAIAADPSASVVKPADRANNQLTALGVLSIEKLESYITETLTWFFPTLRDARRAHPRQEAAYENLKLMLESQVEALDAFVRLAGRPGLLGQPLPPRR